MAENSLPYDSAEFDMKDPVDRVLADRMRKDAEREFEKTTTQTKIPRLVSAT